jgi:DNA polymerase-3 subunit delta'
MAFTSDAAFELLARASDQNRLAHAYLLTGPAGAGKTDLAARLCARLTGSASAGSSPFSHPNVSVAEPESKSRRIIIEQIRELEHALQMRSLDGARKVGIVMHADRMQPQAANAFLKTLEEPPANSLLLLLSSQPEALLDTILSRCITVPLKPVAEPPLTPAQQHLLDALAGYARVESPLLPDAFRMARRFADLLQNSRAEIQETHETELKKEELAYKQTTDGAWLKGREDYYKGLTEARYIQQRNALLEVLARWWGDVLRLKENCPLDFPDHSSSTGAVAARLSLPEIIRRIEALEELRDHLGRNVQEQLAIEVAFLRVFTAPPADRP